MQVKTIKKSETPRTVTILSKKLKPVPSIVYDTYWHFAHKRQSIFFNRLINSPYPWSDDLILNQYKFTNVYRATDRVSQYLIRNVIYKGDQSPDELFFRILIFKIFNRTSTWESLEKSLGSVSLNTYSFNKYNKLLSSLLNNKTAIYSAAYIMASGKSTFGYERKHQNHLRLVEKMIKDKVPSKLVECESMKSAYEILLSYSTIGEFLAYQYVTDINYSTLTNFTEMEFVKAGPGAKNGILKCFQDIRDYTFEDIIRMMSDNQEFEFASRQLNFQTLGRRKLQLIDCQNIFCETDKYARVAHPEIHSNSGRKRIKQKFSLQLKEPIQFYFPPKWGINNLIKEK
jgi:hypothetical protein